MRNFLNDPTYYYPGIERKICKICGKERILTETLGVCSLCILEKKEKSLPLIRKVHYKTREEFHLPPFPPRDEEGIQCNLCVNRCRIGEGKYGYCGLKINEKGKIKHIFGVKEALLDWYYDPLPTNCVAAWVCAATGCGYPKYSITKGTEYGYKNLAVFYRACTFNCLYCQNWHFKLPKKRGMKPEELASYVDTRTTCICYFGGDPTAQIIHAIKASEIALNKKRGILRICYETNGSLNPRIMKKIGSQALYSGGTVKIDLKALREEIHFALTGSSNEWTIQNIKILSELSEERREPPPLAVSTLLVPGYIMPDEVELIANYLKELDPHIPYTLLAFYPNFHINDLPPTSKKHAEDAMRIALNSGLKRVRVGNIHLLW
jgi:pyruvate formate lyase activating enzyme